MLDITYYKSYYKGELYITNIRMTQELFDRFKSSHNINCISGDLLYLKDIAEALESFLECNMITNDKRIIGNCCIQLKN